MMAKKTIRTVRQKSMDVLVKRDCQRLTCLFSAEVCQRLSEEPKLGDTLEAYFSLMNARWLFYCLMN